jgi:peptidoglycan/LPS O-acetylase OafA/YrhL
MIKKIHYPNINSLRFLAAAVVVVHHTEQIKSLKGLPNLWGNDSILMVGKLGVDLFFVLSGFLITSLLFVEQESPKGINVKNFIVRRILRIWPLYFFIMAVAFFLMPMFPIFQLGSPFINVNDNLWANIILYALFLPHVQTVIIGPILYAGQLWSIGIEEQFYLVWSSIVKKLSTKGLVTWIFAYIGFYLGLIVIFRYLVHINYQPKSFKFDYDVILSLLDSLRFDCLLIGALFAVLNKNLSPKTILTNKAFQLFVYAVELYLAFTGGWFHSFFWEIHAVLYGIILMNLVRGDTSLINIEYPVFNYLGKISYGIYMYHILVINIVITIFHKYQIDAFAYPVIFILVIALSAFSYKYIEAYFLKLKNRFSAISTG